MTASSDLEARVDRLERSLRRARVYGVVLALIAAVTAAAATSAVWMASEPTTRPPPPLSRLELRDGAYSLTLTPGHLTAASPEGTLELSGNEIVIGGPGGEGSTGVSREGVLVVGQESDAKVTAGRLALHKGKREVLADVNRDIPQVSVGHEGRKVQAGMFATEHDAILSARWIADVDAAQMGAALVAERDHAALEVERDDAKKSFGLGKDEK